MTQQVLARVDEDGVQGKIVDPGVPSTPSGLTELSAFTANGGWQVFEIRNFRVVTPLRAEEHPILAAIWDNEEDDDIFADEHDL